MVTCVTKEPGSPSVGKSGPRPRECQTQRGLQLHVLLGYRYDDVLERHTGGSKVGLVDEI